MTKIETTFEFWQMQVKEKGNLPLLVRAKLSL